MALIRKSFYLDREQARRLRERAQTRGVSESSIVRAALDAALGVAKPGRERAIEAFLAGVERDVRAGRTWSGKFRRGEPESD